MSKQPTYQTDPIYLQSDDDSRLYSLRHRLKKASNSASKIAGKEAQTSNHLLDGIRDATQIHRLA